MKNERITLQIDKPVVDVNNKKEMRDCAKMIANDLAEQIVSQLIAFETSKTVEYWTKKVKQWDTERIILEKRQTRMTQIHEEQIERQKKWQKERDYHQAKVAQQIKDSGKK